MSNLDGVDVFVDAEEDFDPLLHHNNDGHDPLESDDRFEDAEEPTPEQMQEAPEVLMRVQQRSEVFKYSASTNGWQKASLRTKETSFEGYQHASMVNSTSTSQVRGSKGASSLAPRNLVRNLTEYYSEDSNHSEVTQGGISTKCADPSSLRPSPFLSRARRVTHRQYVYITSMHGRFSHQLSQDSIRSAYDAIHRKDCAFVANVGALLPSRSSRSQVQHTEPLSFLRLQRKRAPPALFV